MEKLKELFKKLKYTEKEMDEIIKFYDQMGYKPETLLSKVKDIYHFLISLGYNEEEVIKMTKSFPTIFGLSIENIKQKIQFYNLIGLSSIAIEDTTRKSKFVIKLKYSIILLVMKNGLFGKIKIVSTISRNNKEI